MYRMPLTFAFLNLNVITTNGIDALMREEFNFSLTDFCILRSLRADKDPIMLSDFERFLMLRKNTLSIATSRLESAGLIEKRSNDTDMRRVSLALTKRGVKVADSAVEKIKQRFFEQMWNEDEKQRITFGMETDAKAYLAFADIHNEKAPKDLDAIPGWIMWLKNIEQIWATEVKQGCGLSLSEFRLLFLLAETKDELVSRDAGAVLNLERSAFSRVLGNVRKKNFVKAKRVESDHRSFSLQLTKEGRTVLNKVRRTLDAQTDQYYKVVSDADIMRFKAWHKDMIATYLRNLGLDTSRFYFVD